MTHSKSLTIFEGPDGAGKSTIAKKYADEIGAKYVHFPALPRVNQSLGRMYVEAMMPALLGYQHVVFDRCWMSETPYGEVHREGRDRLNQASRRMLERLAFRCGAVVVKCLPPVETCIENFRKRKGLEMLRSEQELSAVWGIYETLRTELPMVTYDYTWDLGESFSRDLDDDIIDLRTSGHPLDIQSAGVLGAPVILVGDSFAERKERDSWYQWPFGSFSGEGCSKWLTDELNKAAIRECDLMWVNSDQPLDAVEILLGQQVIALGQIAASACYANKIEAQVVEHPQYWKRFKSNQTYSLIQRIHNATLGD